MATPKNPVQPLEIRADTDGERQFVLHPPNDDLFVRTGRQVIDACGLHIGIELWLKEMTEMLREVGAWAEAHVDAVSMCFAAPLGTRVVIFVVPNNDRFSFDLADDLAELNITLVKRYNVGMVELNQIPSAEIERFVDPATARWVYGKKPASHQPAET